jgi:hypothetical protein
MKVDISAIGMIMKGLSLFAITAILKYVIPIVMALMLFQKMIGIAEIEEVVAGEFYVKIDLKESFLMII